MTVPHTSAIANPLQKIDLSTALQYGTAQGYPPLYSFLRQFARENLHPNVPYLDGPDVILSCGNTDGFSKTIEALTNVWSEDRDWVGEREGILCEEFAYMSAMQSARPRGVQIVPVKIDMEGMLASGPGGLEDVLANWDEKRGKRPHLLYTVTCVSRSTSRSMLMV
jgi:DNA-binding transcriptional MocR family regulator